MERGNIMDYIVLFIFFVFNLFVFSASHPEGIEYFKSPEFLSYFFEALPFIVIFIVACIIGRLFGHFVIDPARRQAFKGPVDVSDLIKKKDDKDE